MALEQAVFRLDDGDNPGEAIVKVHTKLDTQQARTIKAITGYDLYRIEIQEITKPSTFAANPKVGKVMAVSEFHLEFNG